MSTPNERICEYTSDLSSPIEIDGTLYLVGKNGDILSFKDAQLQTEFHFGGQPSAVTLDSTGQNLYVADLAHQAILVRTQDEKGSDIISQLVQDFQGQPLIGPNSLALSENTNQLFFTDSGPFGETSIESPKGSVFIIDLQDRLIRPLALGCLAYPSGLALSKDEQVLYVCETCQNRVIRFVLNSEGTWHFSVFKNFKGRFGPIACAVSASDLLYVARYQFSTLSDQGIISVLNPLGEVQETITLQSAPQISGLTFSTQQSNILYVTENSNQPVCIRVLVQTEDQDETGKGKDLNSSFR